MNFTGEAKIEKRYRGREERMDLIRRTHLAKRESSESNY
jgi:hypothetical protein